MSRFISLGFFIIGVVGFLWLIMPVFASGPVQFRNVYYTPEDNAKAVVDVLPMKARHSIAVEAYSITDSMFVDSLIAAGRRGAAVRIMHDRSQALNNQIVLQRLIAEGNINVKIVESEQGAADHLKMIIIDDVAGPGIAGLGYGSYDFTDEAQLQDNVFIFTSDAIEVAGAIRKFEHDWKHNRALPEWQVGQ